VRTLLDGLPGGQRHRLHGAQDARRHGGRRPRARGPGHGDHALIESGSPAGVKWVTVQAQIKRMEKQFGLKIPVDARTPTTWC
jgi:hypothetical protein